MDRVVFLKSNEEVFEQSTLSWSDYPTRSLTSHGDYQAKLSQYFLDMLRINFASFFFSILFTYVYMCLFWLCWVFIAVCGLSVVAASGATFSLGYTHFSLWWLLVAEHRLLGVRAQ